ncbi:LacI family DNA-binding transcriptional regulator [Anaeromicropila herbilytica]|uniref:Catabolite control protein A n=1 Tax=Anaeromicropila herbilytica TaxID=2785025 RepID=A0A7R7ICL5_9FIRM|nr:LacI family DNA-binding transcriptional regulator [Anaeromicropila herbilytica]BCN30064.1 catabolite control protein A [Anaeromicropila herbilytica]
MAGIKEIAKKCNVSIATVSNILNGKPGASDETKKLVLDTAKSLNYRPNRIAKNLKLRNTKAIGVIIEDLTIFCAPEILDGINEYCEENSYQMIIGNLRLYKKYESNYYLTEVYAKQVQEEFWEMISMQVEGIIYVGGHERKLNFIPENIPVPIVVVYGFGYTENKPIPSVVINDRQGAYLATHYLIESGSRRIGVIGGEFTSFHTQSRLIGYQQALYEHGIYFDTNIVENGNWERTSGYLCAKRLIAKGITDIFVMNDMMAAGVYDYAVDNGIVIGKDLSLVGFDNRELCTAFRPELTTIELPLHRMGYEGAKIMMTNLIKEKRSSEQELVLSVDCELVIRKSVKCETIHNDLENKKFGT